MGEIVISGSDTQVEFFYEGKTYTYWCRRNRFGEIKIETIYQTHGIHEGITFYDRDRKSGNSEFGKKIYKALKESGNI